MKRFAKPLCIILIACLIFTGIVFAEGDKEEEPADEEQTDITQVPEGLGPGMYTDDEDDEDSEDEDEENESEQGYSDDGLRSDDRLYLWIGLQYGSGAVDKITLRCADGFIIVKGNNDGWTETDIRTDSTTMTIVPSGGQATLVDQYGTTILGSMRGGGYVVMSAADDPEDRIITVNGSRYRDGVTATVQGSKLNVINVIELEHYVRGVVANEMGYNYPIEALKAQAITARSYAFRNINKHKSYGFDLCTTQDCQVYRGYISEHDTTDEACAQTEGKVLVYDGEIVEAYYYAYSGGATMNSEDVWLYELDYCRARVDEYYSDYLWAVHYTMQELTDELVKRGRNIGDVTSVQITARHPEGTVAEVTFVGT
ncbi:MAG: SpoIID/LytB domain-containing protein, partial [Clostridia bacterium]|nr:SpoIID/LytB domain-containing protein [Clostridia bacterium]